VRTGAASTEPQPLGQGWCHPVERAREAVRDAVLERVADRRQAGLIAALVTGDQNAIERPDRDLFRATGVARLMSISGLHITMFAWLAAWVVGAAWRRSGTLMLRWPPACCGGRWRSAQCAFQRLGRAFAAHGLDAGHGRCERQEAGRYWHHQPP
jgi:competence protein ComEC